MSLTGKHSTRHWIIIRKAIEILINASGIVHSAANFQVFIIMNLYCIKSTSPSNSSIHYIIIYDIHTEDNQLDLFLLLLHSSVCTYYYYFFLKKKLRKRAFCEWTNKNKRVKDAWPVVHTYNLFIALLLTSLNSIPLTFLILLNVPIFFPSSSSSSFFIFFLQFNCQGRLFTCTYFD